MKHLFTDLIRAFRRALLLGLLPFCLISGGAWAGKGKDRVRVGLEVLHEDPKLYGLVDRKVAVLTNSTAVNGEFKHLVDLLHEHPRVDLVKIFAPEHGFRGADQAGHRVTEPRDSVTNVPIQGLTRRTTLNALEGVEVFVFDIQDIGCRFYTYPTTMVYGMRLAREAQIPFHVLDRPNPINGRQVEGPMIREGYISGIGVYPMPIRHGMTVGELALYFNHEFGIGVDLTVVPMRNWERRMWYDETGLKIWILPSPNMPTIETAAVYPGIGLLEGTNLSEGRGSTRPFELLGAPYIRSEEFALHLNNLNLEAVVFRPASFIPSFHKHRGTAVHGVQLHVLDRERFRPVKTGLAVITAVRDLYPEDFEVDRPQRFNLMMGSSDYLGLLQDGASHEEMVRRWQEELEQFLRLRESYLLYHK